MGISKYIFLDKTRMERPREGFSEETKDILKSAGYKAYEPQPLSDWYNPNSTTYWAVNGVMLAFCLAGRYHAKQILAPRLVWSCIGVSIPMSALMAKAHLDNIARTGDRFEYRRTLEERLDLNPMTRRAWEKANNENTKYQNELKEKIAKLESIES